MKKMLITLTCGLVAIAPAAAQSKDSSSYSDEGYRYAQRAMAEAQREIQNAQREVQNAMRDYQRAQADYQRQAYAERSVSLARVQADRQVALAQAQARRSEEMAARMADRAARIARRQARNNEMLEEMIKDKLIKRGTSIKIEFRDNHLYINGQEQPAAVYEKYKQYGENNETFQLNLDEGIAI